MKEKGIIFNTEMVRAILDGRKTVSRRLLKFDIENDGDYYRGPKTGMVWFNHREFCNKFCTYGQIGDRLYVRETWLQKGGWHGDHWDGWGKHAIAYFADGWPKQKAGETKYRKRPSIHMPKKFSRIWLEITDIRVERVQDISNDQSGEEGMTYLYDYYRSKIGDFDETLSDRDIFEITWDSVYSNWDENPWVWVIKFKKV